ncbi:MAG: sigma-70 family RNA polymerase sigma factor [Oscillatoriales cyanobacterium C42_A2020_001]|nr:sigma-70 family RNA polymerase sigma factor [Leptolyngbyaceae cyanobacterium C42_A2020_001]
MKRALAACESSEKPPTQSDGFWVAYWHQQWRQAAEDGSGGEEVREEIQNSQLKTQNSQSPIPSPLPLSHLAAYLQETCYWSAQRAATTMTSQHLNLADYFQLAIASFPKVIQGYTPAQGASLKTYASLCFGNAIRDGLRRQREADSRSNWGLLRKLSQKCFADMLRQAGLSADAIAHYQLAWNCFKLYCAPTNPTATRHLADPDRATWQTITELYNQQRLKLSPPAAIATPVLLEQWLTQCAKHARTYLHPPTASLNVMLADRTDEFQDLLPAEAEASPMMALLAEEEWQERQTYRIQVQQVLTDAIARLTPPLQELLTLYYAQRWTQQQIAAHLETKQYTVSRRLSSAKETLLLAIAQWSQESLHITPTSTAVKGMSVLLEEWLESHYQAANHSLKEASTWLD